jgi:integrase/recombinase XerD
MWTSCFGISVVKIDLYFDEGFVKITGKGNKERFVPIGKAAQKYIHIYKDSMRVHLNIKKEFGDTLFLRTEGTNKP